MAIVVVENRTGNRYVLVGTGYGVSASATPGVFLGSLAPDRREGRHSMLALCAPNGKVVWCSSDEVSVESVHGNSPAQLLSGQPGQGLIARDSRGFYYLVLGAGFGAFASATPHAFWGTRKPKLESGQHSMIALCDAQGRVGWLESDQLLIERVDGQPPA